MEDKDEIKKYMQFLMQDICDNIGPRAPCSEEEAQCAIYIQDELAKHAIQAGIEKFSCHPGSYKATFKIEMLAVVFSTIFYWVFFFIPHIGFLIASLTSVAFAVLVIHTNLMRNIEFIDPLFKRRSSTNVFGKIQPEEQPRQVVVLGGHHDSNWEFTILRNAPILFGIIIIVPVIFNHLFLIIFVFKIVIYFLSIPYLFIPLIDLCLLIASSCFCPLLIYGAFYTVSNRPVMGADDNLSSIAVLMAIARHFKSTNRLRRTEIWIVSHGCEEIGDRGSKKFSKKHQPELREALVINIDIVGNKNGDLKIDIMEEVVFIKLCKELGLALSDIANDLSIPHEIGNVEAFTDSMAYARNKIRACSIIGNPKRGFPLHYHTREDTIDKIDFENLWKCYRILLEFLKRVDEGTIKL